LACLGLALARTSKAQAALFTILASVTSTVYLLLTLHGCCHSHLVGIGNATAGDQNGSSIIVVEMGQVIRRHEFSPRVGLAERSLGIAHLLGFKSLWPVPNLDNDNWNLFLALPGGSRGSPKHFGPDLVDQASQVTPVGGGCVFARPNLFLVVEGLKSMEEICVSFDSVKFNRIANFKGQ
jgi:hypothetical protein